MGNNSSSWPEDIIKRSDYPQIWYSTRDRSITNMDQFKEKIKNPYGVVD